ncbi:hypothetical protein RvY_07436-2 [Ramazzottius varieornatus]|uniref:Uncharacterized protein n=1 Tax=Ramazzottius varieornatus TaxID=947166 RepID=A0A1D1V892_RAMVA|nr:hypothetical protein RvY_07436-2 [Ramazzottius varieornatus]
MAVLGSCFCLSAHQGLYTKSFPNADSNQAAFTVTVFFTVGGFFFLLASATRTETGGSRGMALEYSAMGILAGKLLGHARSCVSLHALSDSVQPVLRFTRGAFEPCSQRSVRLFLSVGSTTSAPDCWLGSNSLGFRCPDSAR